jgi:hypothetical protein
MTAGLQQRCQQMQVQRARELNALEAPWGLRTQSAHQPEHDRIGARQQARDVQWRSQLQCGRGCWELAFDSSPEVRLIEVHECYVVELRQDSLQVQIVAVARAEHRELFCATECGG